MTILTHATKNEYVPLILKEGLKLPAETGNCNWPEYSASDRISFLLHPEETPFPKTSIGFNDFWYGERTGFFVDPDYLKDNLNNFEAEPAREDIFQTFIKELGIRTIKNPTKHEVPNEVVSFANIPVEGLYALFHQSDSKSEINEIQKQAPAHIRLYSKQTDDLFYRRMK